MNNAQIIGDGYYIRRADLMKENHERDSVLAAINLLKLIPSNVLEIGSADGWRLEDIRKQYDCICNGIDPSNIAIINGKHLYPELRLTKGTADELPYYDNEFDLVIFGHCLYTCLREDLFKISYQADRVLRMGGHLIVYDFYPSVAHYNQSIDCPSVFTYKMDYSKMFSWHPNYRIVHRSIFNEKGTIAKDRLSIIIFKKVEGL